MDNVNTLLSVLAYLVVGIGGAASIYAVFRSRYIKSTVEELRGDRDDQKERIARLEKERDELKVRNAERDAIIKQLQDQNSTLKEALSGKAQLNHLQEQLDAHDKRVDDRHATLHSEMLQVVVSNESVSEKMETLIDSNQYVQAALLDFLKKEGNKNVNEGTTGS